MAVRDIVNYYNEVANQYLDMKHELEDFTELAKKGMFEPERLDAIKDSVKPLMQNYETLSYIMFLLNKPTKKSKWERYEKTNRKRTSQMKSKDEVIKNWSVNRVFMPSLEKEIRDERVKGWNKAVKYAYGWAKED